MNVPPMKMAELVLIGEEERIALVEKYVGYLTGLARIDRVLRGRDKPKPAASAVIEGLEIFLPLGGLIDVEAELARLMKEKEKMEGRIQGLQKKLSNVNFTEKAKPAVVEREREKLASNELHLIKLDLNIELLS